MEQSHQNDPPDPERLHVMSELASVLEEYIEERRARAAEDDAEDRALEICRPSDGPVSQADLADKLADGRRRGR